MLTIGINDGINASVAVCEDGAIVFALQEERVRRVKNYMGFPTEALRFALEHLGLQPGDIDELSMCNLRSPKTNREMFRDAYATRALPKRELIRRGHLRELSMRLLPEAWRAAEKALGPPAPDSAVPPEIVALGLGDKPIRRTHHHDNHAAAAYFGMRKNATDAHLVMTLDGGGDRTCARVYVAQRGRLSMLADTPRGHSIGQIYSRVTQLMGMVPHEHEYKLMGMAAYPRAEHAHAIADRFRGYLDLDPANGLRFKRKVRESTSRILRRMERDFRFARFDNLSRGLQVYTEDLLVRWVRTAMKRTGLRNVVVAGGVFMNVKANKLIAELDDLEFFDVFPSCGDETLPFGACWQAFAAADPDQGKAIGLGDLYLGPDAKYDLDAALADAGDKIVVERVSDPEQRVAQLLAAGKIVGRCAGPMEFGARALGNRSILADPKDLATVSAINRMIKRRDFWMPFAPAILREDINAYVDVPKALPADRISPYMMHSFETKDRRDELRAAVHVADRTARAQVVCETVNPAFCRVLQHFKRLTGRGAILNTSLNLHGYPIVMGTRDTLNVLLNSDLDYVMVEDALVRRA